MRSVISRRACGGWSPTCVRSFPFRARITIADNGSTDATWAIADRLARELPEVRAVHMELPGRGRALRDIWSKSEADVLAYMDVDLSTDLNALLPLVAPLLSGHSDVAIGTRLARGARVIRGPKRELISRGYNLLLRTLMGARFSDAQCGFKAIRRDQARALLPLTRDTGWFFDTELLVLAERAGLRIHEVPVDWIDDLDSRVDIIATALADLRGMARLRAGFVRGSIKVPQLRGPPDGQAAGAPGACHCRSPGSRSSAWPARSPMWSCSCCSGWRCRAQAANVISLLLTAVANTAANRRLTFGISGRSDAARHQVKGLIAVGIGLALTSGSLAMLGSVRASRLAEVSVLIAANLAATVIRFLLYRYWVFGRAQRPPGAQRPRHQPPGHQPPGQRADRTPADRTPADRTPGDRPGPSQRNGVPGRANQLSTTTSVPAPRHATGRPGQNRARRLLRGPLTDPRWARPALFGLLALTAVLYLWDLGRNGWANDFYAAAVQAGTKSWKAFFFGSFDQSSFITVDKTPGSLWVMELSGRIFGFGQWSMLAPQALEGVGSVLLLYAAVKRWFGPAAGLIAGLVLALTPVAALMFRFNNPDALLVLLDDRGRLHAGPRGGERARTKMASAQPALLLGFDIPGQDDAGVPGGCRASRPAYLCAGPPRRLGRRIWQTCFADEHGHRRRGGLVDHWPTQLTPAADPAPISAAGQSTAS